MRMSGEYLLLSINTCSYFQQLIMWINGYNAFLEFVAEIYALLYIEFTSDYDGIIQKNLIQWLLEA